MVNKIDEASESGKGYEIKGTKMKFFMKSANENDYDRFSLAVYTQ